MGRLHTAQYIMVALSILCWPADARTGKVTVQVDRPEVRRLEWTPSEGEPRWRPATLHSSGFEIDLGEQDTLHIEIRGQGWANFFQDWVIKDRLLMTSGTLPVVRAQKQWSPRTLALLGLFLPLLWRRRRPAPPPAYATLSLGHDSAIGLVVAGYRLQRQLGTGGAADVYLGEKDGEHVAIKVLRSRDAENFDRFRREVEVTKKMSHPNIVRLYDYGEQDGRFYLVLELMDAGNLRARLGSPVPPADAAELLKPLFSAVSYAHQQGLVHRDLKPENVLLNHKSQLKITDFGLAKTHDVKTITEHGVALGSPSYMAPEQIQGSTRDFRIDQYALGIITYEVLKGQVPFLADDTISVIYKHLGEPVPPLGINPRLDGTVERMLAKDPELRYPTVEDAWRALESALMGPSQEDTGAILKPPM